MCLFHSSATTPGQILLSFMAKAWVVFVKTGNIWLTNLTIYLFLNRRTAGVTTNTTELVTKSLAR